MYTIPYFLINEAKNLIKVKINEITNNITDEIINNIIYVFNYSTNFFIIHNFIKHINLLFI